MWLAFFVGITIPVTTRSTTPISSGLSIGVLLVLLAMVSTSGCAWVAETLLSNAFGEYTRRDGRDEDADGLTHRDIVAREEESTIREWDRERRWAEWSERQAAANPQNDFHRSWQEHLNRDREAHR